MGTTRSTTHGSPSELPAPTTGTKSRSPSNPPASPTGIMRSRTGNENWCVDLNVKTRMHSSRMRTIRSLPYVGRGFLSRRSLSGGGLCQTRSDIIQRSPTPCKQNDWQAGVKTWPSRNFICRRQKGSSSSHCCVLAGMPLALDCWLVVT